MLNPIFGAGVDVVKELSELLDRLEAKHDEQDRNSLAHNSLLELVSRLRPKIPEANRDNLRNEIKGIDPIEAAKHIRARLGLSLREAKDYYDSLMRQ